jgi:hypothetical protein
VIAATVAAGEAGAEGPRAEPLSLKASGGRVEVFPGGSGGYEMTIELKNPPSGEVALRGAEMKAIASTLDKIAQDAPQRAFLESELAERVEHSLEVNADKHLTVNGHEVAMNGKEFPVLNQGLGNADVKVLPDGKVEITAEASHVKIVLDAEKGRLTGIEDIGAAAAPESPFAAESIPAVREVTIDNKGNDVILKFNDSGKLVGLEIKDDSGKPITDAAQRQEIISATLKEQFSLKTLTSPQYFELLKASTVPDYISSQEAAPVSPAVHNEAAAPAAELSPARFAEIQNRIETGIAEAIEKNAQGVADYVRGFVDKLPESLKGEPEIKAYLQDLAAKPAMIGEHLGHLKDLDFTKEALAALPKNEQITFMGLLHLFKAAHPDQLEALKVIDTLGKQITFTPVALAK